MSFMLYNYMNSFNFVTSSHLGYFWNMGFVLFFFLFLMIFSGMMLACNYTPTLNDAFDSVNYIYGEMSYGWLISDIHCVGSSFFWFFIYLHIFSSMFFALSCNSLVWISGFFIYFFCIIVSFLGYCLPMGSMSYWAIIVVINFFSVFPFFDFIKCFILGDDNVCDLTLKSFFVFHVLLPFLMLIFSFLHVFFLHVSGSSSGGFEHFKVNSFYPYMFFKDLFFLCLVLLFFIYCVFFIPLDFYNYVNFNKFNSFVTPEHMTPEWYLVPFFLILKSFSSKMFGMFFLVLCFIMFFFSFITCNFSYIFYYSVSSFFFGFLFIFVFFVFVFYLDSNLSISIIMYYYSYLFLFCLSNLSAVFEFGILFFLTDLFFYFVFLFCFFILFLIYFMILYFFYLHNYFKGFYYYLVGNLFIFVDMCKAKWFKALKSFSFINYYLSFFKFMLILFNIIYCYYSFFFLVIILFFNVFFNYYLYYFFMYFFKFLCIEMFRVSFLIVCFVNFYSVGMCYFFVGFFGILWFIFFVWECTMAGFWFYLNHVLLFVFYLLGVFISWSIYLPFVKLLFFVFNSFIMMWEESLEGGIDSPMLLYLIYYLYVSFLINLLFPFILWVDKVGMKGVGNYINDLIEDQIDHFLYTWVPSIPGDFVDFFKSSSYSSSYDQVFYKVASEVSSFIQDSCSSGFWKGFKKNKELWDGEMFPISWLISEFIKFLDKTSSKYSEYFIYKYFIGWLFPFIFNFMIHYRLNECFSFLKLSIFKFFIFKMSGVFMFLSVCSVTSHLFNFDYFSGDLMSSLMSSYCMIHYIHIFLFILFSFFITFNDYYLGANINLYMFSDSILWVFSEMVWFFFLLVFLLVLCLLSTFLL